MHADTLLTIVVTAFATAVLTGAVTLGVWWCQRAAQVRDARVAVRDAAYIELIRCVLDFTLQARALAETVHFRSGLKGWAYKPLDPVDYFPRMVNEFKPLNAAWSSVHVHGTQAGIDLADKLLGAAADLLEAATAVDVDRPKLARLLLGERWTETKQATFGDALRRLVRHRTELIHLARKESGRDSVFMAIDKADDEHATSAIDVKPQPVR